MIYLKYNVISHFWRWRSVRLISSNVYLDLVSLQLACTWVRWRFLFKIHFWIFSLSLLLSPPLFWCVTIVVLIKQWTHHYFKIILLAGKEFNWKCCLLHEQPKTGLALTYIFFFYSAILDWFMGLRMNHKILFMHAQINLLPPHKYIW